MTTTAIAYPKIVSRDQWLVERKTHRAHEKELTKQLDGLRAERRRLPMVEIDKGYVFEGPDGKARLIDQLIVYHFMFDPGAPPVGKSGEP